MLKRYSIVIVVLMAYTLIIFLPPLVYGYVYPNNGDDTAFHLRYFDAIANGENATLQYLGQNIVGYPLVWVSNLTGASIDTLFMWFNFSVLWLVGIMAFTIVAKFVDWRAGLLAIPMVMFMTPSTLNLYDTGAVFDLVTVGVILPVALYCVVKLWVTKKWYWSLPLLVALVMVVIVHSMVLWHAVQSAGAEKQTLSLPEFASVFLGYGVVLIFLVTVFWAIQSKKLKIDKQVKVLIACLSTLVLFMGVLVFTGFIGWSLRIALDMSIMFPMLVACLLGVVLKGNKNGLVWGIVCVFVLLASLPVTSSYVRYNSAVKPLDMKVFEYVNSLDGAYYSCSPEVAPWIYDRFLNKQYKEGELPHIIRSEPMTSRTSPDSFAYWWEHKTVGYGRDYEKEYIQTNGAGVEFKENGLEITVID